MSMIKTLNNISGFDQLTNKHALNGVLCTVKSDCSNDMYKERLPTIPAGTEIVGDFAGDFGMYGLCEIDGVLHRIKVELHELHKIDFGTLDARN